MKVRTIVNKTYKEEVVGKWVQPLVGYDNCAICTISADILSLSLKVFYGSEEDFSRYIKDLHSFNIPVGGFSGMFVHMTDKNGDDSFFLTVGKMQFTAEEYGTLCHELHHFTHTALEKRGIEYSVDSEEIFAYLQGHFMTATLRAFVMLSQAVDKNRKKKKSKDEQK